uniref:Uncharacterized protein n=1 Tax=Rhizophora mucronata TaxID=61149 RepID=A0A2P2N775_RHIMU
MWCMGPMGQLRHTSTSPRLCSGQRQAIQGGLGYSSGINL